jgi:UDP-galactopyranose mutase
MSEHCRYDFLVVGAGFAGSVCAQQLAERGRSVLLIDRRSHIGGNAYDARDAHGLLVHPYGPHIFHTNSEQVFQYLSRFTEWHGYEHRVLARVGDKLCPIPINRTTINMLYGLGYTTDKEAQRFFDSVRVSVKEIRTSEDVVLNSVGRDLCEKFFSGYTRKQWGLELSELSPSVATRIPFRVNDDDRFFTDTFQSMPRHGYTRMFERMLDTKGITTALDTDLKDLAAAVSWGQMIFTGPVDSFYDFRFGRLPYRSIRFVHEHIPGQEWHQPVTQVNYPNDHEYTRITEFKHMTGDVSSGTSIMRDFPQAEGDPFYPIPQEQNQALYKRYKELADNEKNVIFVGRLAEYKYYNMDQVVASAFQKIGPYLK